MLSLVAYTRIHALISSATRLSLPGTEEEEEEEEEEPVPLLVVTVAMAFKSKLRALHN